jgi:hypothetical protein
MPDGARPSSRPTPQNFDAVIEKIDADFQGVDARGLGRSRGGLSTTIHAAGDALGLPVRLIGTLGSATLSPQPMILSRVSMLKS